MALESTGKEGGREGREKSLATIEMKVAICAGRGKGEFAELKRSPATDYLGTRFWVEWKPMVKGRKGGRLIGS